MNSCQLAFFEVNKSLFFTVLRDDKGGALYGYGKVVGAQCGGGFPGCVGE